MPAITRLLRAYLALFKLRPLLSEEEVAHWLLPRAGVVDSFVVDTATAAAEAATTAAAAASVAGGGGGGSSGGGGGGAPAPAVHPASQSTITDFISFYHLPSTIIGHEKHKVLSAVYAYYMVPGANVCPSSAAEAAAAGAGADDGGASARGEARRRGAAGAAAASSAPVGHTLPAIMGDALILAKQRGVDVFNALDLMEHDPAVLRDLKFGAGDGHLQYYLYNWGCPEISAREVGLVLL